jgi:hypothetical protein
MSLPPELGLLTNLKHLYVRHSQADGAHLDLTNVTHFRPTTTSSRRCQLKSAS